jgi:hypothetical protein
VLGADIVRDCRCPSNLPDLAAIVAAWPELPEAIKAGILAMVKAAQKFKWSSTSALSQLNFRVDRREYAAGVVDLHLPIDAALGVIHIG